jgi:hypothetical protein
VRFGDPLGGSPNLGLEGAPNQVPG